MSADVIRSSESSGWISGGAAALLLGVSHNLLIRHAVDENTKPKETQVRRRRQRVSHAQRICPWYYNREDVMRWREYRVLHGQTARTVEQTYDVTGKYITALQAAWLLGLHSTAVYDLSSGRRRNVDGLRIRTRPKCLFLFPRKRHQTGYLLTDVLSLKERREATESTAAFVEERVEASSLIEKANTERQFISFAAQLFKSYDKAEIDACHFVSSLRDRFTQTQIGT